MKEEGEIEQVGFAKMDGETAAFPDLLDFEFFVIILQNPWEKLKLPDKFAKLLDGQEPREVTLREASGGRYLWDVEVLFDGEGRMYLDRGWERFARAHDLGLGNFLVFSYDGDGVLTVKVFDGSMCCRHYHDDDEETTGGGISSDSCSKNSMYSVSNDMDESARKNSSSTGERNIEDALTSQFTVTLKPSHLGARQKQYLNVPPAFQHAHEYDSRSEVVLRMRGEKWTVTLKHNIRKGGHRTRASLRYGWHQFCVDNRLGVGDVCFFRALRGDGGGDDHALKVEVRKRDGTFLE
ncbi:B3 domain-containing protein Os03g0212300 [Lolium perenne]|uniref:B3 domain-containing protein Os03g0212300 n=1 Tax=Lolium perenne TaxID=4522 RepID=UPI0021F5C1B7|nr:B3 domain-containing protein Os03g0212300-like isoform X1 [Lolium perenne]